MRIVIMGSGGVGGYFGGRMVEAGHDVTFIARGDHLRALQNDGIHIKSPKGDFAGPVHATDDPNTIEAADLVIIATKAWQVTEAGNTVKPVVGPETAVLPLQNGVEAAPQLIEVLGPQPVLGGLCRIISYVSRPGEITHLGADPTIVLGELDGSESERCARINEVLNSGPGMRSEIAGNIHVALWQKFLLMPPVSSVGAATRAPLGVIRQVPGVRQLLIDAMHEVRTLAVASGVQIPEDAVETTMAFIDKLPENSTASMQRDIADGKPSELEAQTGAVVRIGKQLNVPVPVHEHLYHALLPLELRARGKIEFPE